MDHSLDHNSVLFINENDTPSVLEVGSAAESLDSYVNFVEDQSDSEEGVEEGTGTGNED
jgi:hypothetical protein